MRSCTPYPINPSPHTMPSLQAATPVERQARFDNFYGELAPVLIDFIDALGIEPASLLRGLMESLHAVTRSKAGGSADLLASVEEPPPTTSM